MQVLRALRVALGGSARGWPPQATPDRCIAEISGHLEDTIVHSRVYGQQQSLHLQEAAVVQPAVAAGQTPATVMECLPEAAMQSISMAVMHTTAVVAEFSRGGHTASSGGGTLPSSNSWHAATRARCFSSKQRLLCPSQ